MNATAGTGRRAALRRWAREHETQLRFVAVGGFNTGVGLATYPVLYLATRPWGLHYLLVLLLSHAFCQAVAFLTSKHFVFRTRGNYLPEFGHFVTFHLAHLGVNLVVLPLLVELLGLNPVWAQPGFTVLVVVTSYFWHSRVTFSSTPTKHP
jgi:putative flippase GtrA